MSAQQTIVSVAVADGNNGADAMGSSKIFVLDTNVLIHDPTSIFRFERHDVYVPMTTLEELDNHKSGNTEIARNSREVSRIFEGIIQSNGPAVTETIPNSSGGTRFQGH